jgi:hypothetical protein
MTIQCPKCKAENPDTQSFCGDFGTQLPLPEKFAVTETIEATKEELTRRTTLADRYEIIKEVFVMLKKYLFGILVLLGLLLAVVPVQANKSVQFTPAVGTMWDQLFLWTLGLSVDLYLTKYLTITPEFFMANKNIGFSMRNDENMGRYDPTYFLQPGVMLNYHHPSFFIGVGVVKSHQARNAYHYEGWPPPRTVVWDVVWSSEWKLKLNAGFKISHIRFTVFLLSKKGYYVLPWILMVRGATIGYTF